MIRFTALLGTLFLTISLHAAGLFDAGVWVPIVVPATPDDEEWRAARTLADWCERVTGVRPKIVSEGLDVPSPISAIYVGHTIAAQTAGVRAPEAEGDTARRAVIGDAVFLVGNNPFATRIAVGRFCEQHLGVFFAFPGEQGADWTPRHQVGLPIADVFVPDFHWRQLSGLNALSDEWACSVGFGRVPSFSHAIFRVFDRRVWHEERQLFPIVDGQRRIPKGNAADAHPRLDHPRAPEIAARYAREYFWSNPNAFAVPLGMNDNYYFDDNAKSEGWYRNRPVRTDYIFGFLNSVADSAWAPDGDFSGERHAIGALAYMQALRAPTIPIRPAIFPWVCTDRIGYGNSQFADQDRANVAAWAKSGARRVGVYDYIYGVPMSTPRVNFTALIQSIRATHTAGARGWVAEAYPIWAFDAPKLWLAAKLLENKAAQTPELLETWFTRAYGPAAHAMLGVYTQIEAAWKRDANAGGKDQFLRHYNDQSGALVINESEIAAIESLLRTAKSVLLFTPKYAGSDRARQARQFTRLSQFLDAWELYRAFRLTVQTRQVSPTASQSLDALRQFSAAESIYEARESEFNLNWGAYGPHIQWSKFPSENPRTLWSEQVLGEGRKLQLEEWAKSDSYKGLIALHVAKSAQSAPVSYTYNFSTSQKPCAIELAPFINNRIDKLDAGLRILAPAGKLGPIAVDSDVVPYKLVRFKLMTWTERLGVADSQAVLTFRFIGGASKSETSIICQPRQTVLPCIIPEWATRMEYEISFREGVFVEKATIQFSDLIESPAQ